MSFFEPTSRILYDQNFIDAGCPEADYNQDFELDGTVGTWSTNFAIAFVGVVAFVKLGSYGCATASHYINVLMPYFFLAMGISFFVAAIGHIVVTSRSQKQSKAIFEVITSVFFGGSSILLALYGLALVNICMLSHETWKKGIWWTTLTLLTAVGIYAAFEMMAAISFMGMLVYLTTTVLYLVARPKIYVIKALGTLIMLASLVIQIILRTKCGDPAYVDCFKNCPFNNPMEFNHNGLFHVVYLVGIAILFVAEDRNPSVVTDNGVTETSAEKPNEIDSIP
ncbi:hypothetical protein FRACYDRAFT_263130 [Fragilariopsis cylindrus CCMP1102]|uniref:Uncharacterized protein n=1 Tax=Fragilariopsis cylindrus CCMP1102 TaxID=635003 RepID=A0A1E7F1X1_9STRA|nr:hypothetical protein FRACYDRAFT_263130 [Fragilariopsis cylindrus CCMP1102]|eukprot:OEU12104.1 hypothetical protein FRACYDRAFT_263130 [Fragilariopsis cylindrus CCMP1102]